ncbi:hypothetical protein QQ045_009518 [Rhodiola kirilowii]
MARNSFGKAVKSVAKAVGEYQYPWREKLEQHKNACKTACQTLQGSATCWRKLRGRAINVTE